MNILEDAVSSESFSSISSSSQYHGGDEESDSGVAVIFTIFLILALLLSILWLHESLAILVMGTLVGFLQYAVFPKALGGLGRLFSPGTFSEVFYKILFPPVIFNAGFTLKKRNFMKNIVSILTVAFIGTILSSIFNLLIFYEFGSNLGIGSSDFVECFIFAALLSCTDTVATMAVLVEINVQPLLYSLVFGESVLNDAVAIALVRALTPYVGSPISAKTIGTLTLSFIEIVFGSFAVGLLVGLLAAFLAAREAKWNLSSTYQMTQILIFAYFSYELAELFEFSGVISLFVCALIMSHYCWYSISVNSRKSLFQIAGLLDYLSEILVFMSFGILLFTTGNFQKDKWNPIFIVIVICSILISRLASVLILTNGLNIFRKEKIPFKFQLVLWWCGMRGIVTLLLALSMDTPNRKLFLNTTYVVIFFTNIVIGLLTRPLVANLGVRSEVEGVNTLDPSATMSKISIDSVKKDKERSAFARWWFIIDNKYLKKIFGGRQRMLDDGKHKNAAAAAAAAGGGGSGDAAILGGDGDADDVIADITDDSPSTKRGRGGKGKGKGRRGTAADPARQSLNATGAATVAVISESDASDAEKLAGVPLLGGGGGDGSDSGSEEVFSSSSSSSSSSSVTPEGDDDDDDDDEKHEVIAPMSDTIRYMSAVDGGDGDNGRSHGHGHGRRRNHHHKQQQQHHHHYQYQHSLTLQQQKHTKSYGSFGTMVMGDDQYHQPTNVLDYSSSLIRSGPSSDNSGGGDVGGGGSTSSDDDGDNIVKMCSISPNENTSLLK